VGVELEDVRKLEQLDDIDPALSALDTRHEGLMSARRLGHLGLLKISLPAIPGKELHKRVVLSGASGACRPRDEKSGSAPRISSNRIICWTVTR
jgi:hypothetical protein